MRKSSNSPPPRKPYRDFPLFPHGNGQWAKKIRGKCFYFGTWDEPDAALKKYAEQRDDLQAGRTARVQQEGLTLRELVNQFLTGKRMMVAAHELTPRSWRDYHVTCKRLLDLFGMTRIVIDLGPDDFQRFKGKLVENGNKPITVGNEIRRVKVVFNWANEQGLID